MKNRPVSFDDFEPMRETLEYFRREEIVAMKFQRDILCTMMIVQLLWMIIVIRRS